MNEAAQQGDEADEAFGGMVAGMDMPPHARAVMFGRGHRFAAYPRCSADTSVREPRVDWRLYAVYTDDMRPIRAKLFQNGGSQAVRLPKAYRFSSQREVLVHREGRRVILEPADEWSQGFRACLGSVAEDVPRPKQELITSIRNPFD